MQAFAVPILPSHLVSSRVQLRPRTALVASADRSFRQRLTQVLPVCAGRCARPRAARRPGRGRGGAPEAVIVDSWLPDLDLAEFLSDFRPLSRGRPGDGGGVGRRGEPARALSAGTALCAAPVPGDRYSGVERGSCAARSELAMSAAAEEGAAVSIRGACRLRPPSRKGPRLWRRPDLLRRGTASSRFMRHVWRSAICAAASGCRSWSATRRACSRSAAASGWWRRA